MYKPTFESTKAAFEALFEEFGLPDQIHTDNGEPFASTVSLSRLTRLAVWFMDLGIVPVYSDPGHPEQNPEHERMHKDLKAASARPPAWSLGRQQQKFEAFRYEHNDVRPHQSLYGGPVRAHSLQNSKHIVDTFAGIVFSQRRYGCPGRIG